MGMIRGGPPPFGPRSGGGIAPLFMRGQRPGPQGPPGTGK